MTKTVVTLISVTLLVVGVLGFFNDPVFGIFEVDTVHNLVHVLSGAVGLIMAAQGSARGFAIGFGLIYGLVTALGFSMHNPAATSTKLFGLLEINHADNYLHAALAVVLLFVGLTSPSSPSRPARM